MSQRVAYSGLCLGWALYLCAGFLTDDLKLLFGWVTIGVVVGVPLTLGVMHRILD